MLGHGQRTVEGNRSSLASGYDRYDWSHALARACSLSLSLLLAFGAPRRSPLFGVVFSISRSLLRRGWRAASLFSPGVCLRAAVFVVGFARGFARRCCLSVWLFYCCFSCCVSVFCLCLLFVAFILFCLFLSLVVLVLFCLCLLLIVFVLLCCVCLFCWLLFCCWLFSYLARVRSAKMNKKSGRSWGNVPMSSAGLSLHSEKDYQSKNDR